MSTNNGKKAPASKAKKAPQTAVKKSSPAAAKQVANSQNPAQPSPELLAQISKIRSSVRENFGKAAMSMMMLPRYRGQSIGDLQHLVLEPLMRDRLAMAYPGKKAQTSDTDLAPDMLGFAIWASVSEDVDKNIREQIKSGVFPVRLKADEWQSGEINWLLDVVAPNAAATASVIANFRQVVKEGALALHPMITRLVDKETLEKMGAIKSPTGDKPAEKAAADLPKGAPEEETIN